MSGLSDATELQAKQPLVPSSIREPLEATLGALRQAVPTVLHRVADAVPPLARMRDVRRLRYRMRTTLGYEPNFHCPSTFNERVACKILYDRNPLIPLTTDKVAARDYVATKVGRDILLPLFGVWDRAADVPWDNLPSSFALKGSHGWQMNLLVRDKAATDRNVALQQAERWLSTNHYKQTGEWGYRDIQPRLLAEALIISDRPSGVPEDFKFYVFHGQPRLLGVHLDRGTGGYGFQFHDPNNLSPLSILGGNSPEEVPYTPPPEIRDLASIAARLGADFDFVRVDLYFAGGQAWFGELTHYPASACIRFPSLQQDRLLGDMWANKV